MMVLERLNLAIGAVLRVLLVIAVGILVFPVTLQIISRFTTLIPSYIWTEEMARFSLVWTVMIGAMLGVREGQHFIVDIFPPMQGRRLAVMDLVANLFTLVFALVFLWWGWEFTGFAWYRISELAELPLWMIHIAWPIFGVVAILSLAERMLKDIGTLAGGTR